MSTSSRTRTALVAGVSAATLGAGALGLSLAPAGATEQPPPGAGARAGVLDELVADGTLTEEQAAAVRDRVRSHREEHPGSARRLARGAIRTSAEVIGIEPQALVERLRAGESIAAVAEAEGVERQAVVDAIVAAADERLDTAVAEGRITQERADEAATRLPDLAARIVDRTPTPR